MPNATTFKREVRKPKLNPTVQTFENWTKWELAPNTIVAAILLLLFIAFISHYFLRSCHVWFLMSDYPCMMCIFNVHWSGVRSRPTGTTRLARLWLLHGWHMKLLPSRRKFCVHRSTMHQFTVTSFKAMHTLGLDLSIEIAQEMGP